MLDIVLATVSMLSLVVFMGVVAVFVNEPDLWIVIIVVLVMGSYDFVREVRREKQKKEQNPDA